MTIHRTIRVALSPEQARDLVERSFDADGGWSLSQRGDDAFAHPRDPCEYLLDPPQAFAQASVFPIPEILAVRVSFRGTDDGTEVRARIVRHRIAWLVRDPWDLKGPDSEHRRPAALLIGHWPRPAPPSRLAGHRRSFAIPLQIPRSAHWSARSPSISCSRPLPRWASSRCAEVRA